MTASKVLMQASPRSPHESELLEALPLLVARLSPDNTLHALNRRAAEFFGDKFIVSDALVQIAYRVRAQGESVTAHDFSIQLPLQEYRATLHALVYPDDPQYVLLTFDLKGTPHAPAASAWKQEITQAAGVMAAMMAHEVKNPLSSIRGAAQLLRDTLGDEERGLADLICQETLRIRDLLDQMEIFSNDRAPELSPLNIHEALQYCMRVAKAGFASHVTFIETYDPSLPLAHSHRELLIQLFLNILKNAAEALGDVEQPTITLSTAYQSGFSLTDKKLPLVVTIADNGQGIPGELRRKLFEPLISSKAQGRGLGLAVVAKIAADIGAIVQCVEPEHHQGAKFAIHLPLSIG